MRNIKILGLALASILALPLTAMAAPDTKPAPSPTAPATVKSPGRTAHHATAKHHSKSGKRSHKPAASK